MATPGARVEFRLPSDEKEVIEQAVRLLGISITEFARPRLLEDARKIVAEHSITRLTDRDRDIFLTMLEADGEPAAALRKAFRKVR